MDGLAALGLIFIGAFLFFVGKPAVTKGRPATGGATSAGKDVAAVKAVAKVQGTVVPMQTIAPGIMIPRDSTDGIVSNGPPTPVIDYSPGISATAKAEGIAPTIGGGDTLLNSFVGTDGVTQYIYQRPNGDTYTTTIKN